MMILKNKGFSIFLILTFLTIFISPNVIAVNISGDFTTTVESETNDDKEIFTSNILGLQFTHNTRSSSFRASVELGDNDQKFSLKEAYGILYLENTDLIIGKQNINWGKADLFNPTNYFNPEDLRSPFRDDNKLAVNALRTKSYYGDCLFDFVWLPVFTEPIFPEGGDRWSQVPEGIKIEPIKPETGFENSGFGLRISKWSGAVDYSFSYFHGLNKEPYWPLVPVEEDDELIIKPYFAQMDVLGVDFARDFGTFVLRGEAAHFIKEENLGQNESYHQYALGVDYNLTDKLYINTQVSGEVERKNDQHNIMISAQYEISSFKSLEINTLYNIEDNDFMINPVFNYNLMDGIDLNFGGYVFEGREKTMFGSFTDRDYVYMKLKKSF